MYTPTIEGQAQLNNMDIDKHIKKYINRVSATLDWSVTQQQWVES